MAIVSPSPRTVLSPLPVSWSDPDLRTEALCLACGEPLSIHQPDVNSPERLLGTCVTCGAWHLVDADRGITVLPPDANGFHEAEADS